jgi:hypothetical protein
MILFTDFLWLDIYVGVRGVVVVSFHSSRYLVQSALRAVWQQTVWFATLPWYEALPAENNGKLLTYNA